MRGTHLVSVVAILLGVQVGTPAAASPAESSTATSIVRAADATRSGPGAADRRDLVDDAVRPTSGAGRAARIRPWPGRVIRYHESIPSAWDWSLDRAVDHWNGSGSDIRFVEVSKKRARLLIRYGPTGGADGVGTLGYQAKNYVHLSTSYRRADQHDPETRVWVGRLFAHELGHVLGFSHTAGQCSLMVAIYDFGLCPPLPDDKPGYYHCRWIDAALLRRFVRKYGGRAKRPAPLCLIEALPAQLRDVTFAGGATDGRPVRITWRRPTAVRAGSLVRVTVWKGSPCRDRPDSWDRRDAVDPRSGEWLDAGFGQGSWCYLVQVENRYGATRPPLIASLSRYAPVPAAPTVPPPTWHRPSTSWRFTWRAPSPGMQLVAVRDDVQPDQCTAGFDEDRATWLAEMPGDAWRLDARAPQECVSLYVVTDWATTSPPTQVQLVVPDTPSAPVVGPRTWDPDWNAFRFGWTPPDHTSLVAMRNADDPTVCVPAYDADRAEWVDREHPTTTHLLWVGTHTECVSLFAITSWGAVSPRTEVVLRVPAPTVAPTVGTIGVWSGDPSAASATVGLAESPHHRIGVEVVRGACPARPPADSAWWDGYEDFDRPGRWYWYPEPWGDTGTQCAFFAAVDSFGQHGPVVARTFSVHAP